MLGVVVADHLVDGVLRRPHDAVSKHAVVVGK